MNSTVHSPPAAAGLPLRREAQAPSAWWATGLAAAVAWAALGALTLGWPNKQVGFSDWNYTAEFGWVSLGLAAALAVLSLGGRLAAPVVRRLRGFGPWLTVLGVGFLAWEVVTAKLGWLPTPFFASPQSLADVYVSDWRRLSDSAANSLILLGVGIGSGAAVGFVVGVLMGWSRRAHYWIHPVLRVLGPIPTTALLPISFYFFPSSWSTAVFLIAMGTGFPAAMPQVFVGLFMGLGHAFATLVVAEMLGVKSGLGWYLTWAQGWASYPNMYGALLVMALLFSGVITLLFTVRDRVLSWQKGVVQW